MKDTIASPLAVNIPSGSLLYILFPFTLTPVVIVFPNTYLSLKVVNNLLP